MFTPEALLASFCYILELSPVHLLAYYPFRDNFRFPSWMVFLLAGSNLCAQFFVCCYLYQAGQDARNIDIFFAVTSMIIYFSCIRTELPKLLFIYIMVLDYMMIIRGISVFLAIQFFYNPQTPYVWLGSPLHTMLRLFPCLLSAPFMLYFLNITKERVLKSYAPRLWSMVWLLPALTTFIVLLLTWNFNMISTSGLTFLIARMALLIIFITIYYLFIDSLESLRLQGEAQERARNQEKFISMQHLQYIQLQKQIEETRRARHDLRQHLNLIQAYLDKGDNETLRDYIDKYGKSLPLNTGKVYCSNYAIDTVIRYYAEKAADEKIQFDTQIKLPEKLAIEEPDICILFGNLLENAVDSCRQYSGNPPFIRVRAQIAGDCAVSIIVDNSCPSTFRQNDPIIPSTKHEGPGLGTLSIRNIAAQYHGIADFQCENEVFYASVFLNPSGRMQKNTAPDSTGKAFINTR